MPSPAATLDRLYDLLREAESGAVKFTCKRCGRDEEGFFPFVYIPPDAPLHERILKEEYNRQTQKAIDTGNVLCCDCAAIDIGISPSTHHPMIDPPDTTLDPESPPPTTPYPDPDQPEPAPGEEKTESEK